jgi:hypothetical protein
VIRVMMNFSGFVESSLCRPSAALESFVVLVSRRDSVISLPAEFITATVFQHLAQNCTATP